MNVNELSGAELDRVIAEYQGFTDYDPATDTMLPPRKEYGRVYMDEYSYSTDWSLGGPLIERERMGVWNCEAVVDADGNVERDKCWYAEDKDGDHVQTGATPLIAAMRCYVASKQGE